MIDIHPHNRRAGITIAIVLLLLLLSAFLLRFLNDNFVPVHSEAESDANTSVEKMEKPVEKEEAGH